MFLWLLGSLFLWLLLFAVGRAVFLLVNSLRAVDVEPELIGQAFVHGLPYDISVWGYVGVATCLLFLLLWWKGRAKAALYASCALTVVCAAVCLFLLPADALVYRAWGHHPTASDLLMFTNGTDGIWASVDKQAVTMYLVGSLALVLFFAWCFVKMARRVARLLPAAKTSTAAKVVAVVEPILLGALLIIPIRGGLGIVPLNSGRAYFSSSVFANHLAVNPIWNFLYSTKRASSADQTYPFLEEADMQARFQDLMALHEPHRRKIDVYRPNIVVVLLESFAAHGVEYLGGAAATPRLDSLRRAGIGFTNFFAAADRSGKGLIATLCGYPALPTVSPIQFPTKTQTLNSLPAHLRKFGYANQAFVYGGDLNFNNFNSLVRQCGFDNVVTADDFDDSQKGDKWGAHDQYTFQRLLQLCNAQREPFFNFLFTLSSHEPYDVPYHKLQEPYLNSVAYTDSCLGAFVDSARRQPWFAHTLFVFLADHGTPGPEQVDETDRRRFNIPLILYGPDVLTASDSTVTSYCSQVDLPTTLLRQVGIPQDLSPFSRDIFALGPNEGHAFFDFNDGFGYADQDNYLVRDNEARRWLRLDVANADTLDAMAFLQKLADDFRHR